jgi:ABC-type multidrug transport system ATPase subunit
MHALLRRLYERHRPAVLLVTHDVDEAVHLADRVLVLREGRIAVDLAVTLPGPRSRRDPRFQEYRDTLLAALGVPPQDAARTADAGTARNTTPLGADGDARADAARTTGTDAGTDSGTDTGTGTDTPTDAENRTGTDTRTETEEKPGHDPQH